MILTKDQRIEALLRGEPVPGVRLGDLPAIKDAVDALNAAGTLEDTLFVGLRTIRAIVNRRRRYYVDVGSAYWIYFEWRVHDAINVRLVRLRRTTLGPAFGR